MCTLASVWCLLFNYTIVSADGIKIHEEQWEFLSEIAPQMEAVPGIAAGRYVLVGWVVTGGRAGLAHRGQDCLICRFGKRAPWAIDAPWDSTSQPPISPPNWSSRFTAHGLITPPTRYLSMP